MSDSVSHLLQVRTVLAQGWLSDFSFFDFVNVGSELRRWAKWLSMSIGSMRYSPDNVRTRDSTTYFQFLKIFDSPPVGYEDTIITSFDIPCNLWPVVPSLEFAGIWCILHWNIFFLKDVGKCFRVLQVRNSLVQGWTFDYYFLLRTCPSVVQVGFCLGLCLVLFPDLFICDSSCTMYPGLLTCSHCIHSTSFALTVHTFFP